MKISELKDILLTRVGWDDDKTVTGFVVSPDNSVSDSGTYFQGEHSAVTLQNIRETQPVVKISEDDFNDYLGKLKSQVASQVLSDTFEKDYVNDKLITLYPTAFDTLLRLRMVIVVGELIMTSTRSNRIERMTENFIGKLNYDIFRDTVQKFANQSTSYRYSMAVATRYEWELRSVQRRFGTQRNLVKTITKGESFNEYYPYHE